ncbi:hypothetical protein FBY10_1209 [Pseudomonas sp. SJZ103]|uniref:hypothetical protein n=1 Tax=unclassified Pseudomonas TaxID=196821 RepID=UPI00119D3CDA|nr:MULTISPECIES: hypothetical protein [unclassified Pseudomonas]MBB6290775.1 hypothetical protein [Pseudomonas sp. SJZ073]MBB6315497.1 hypothetical protein [Pseudomonas sp. JAI120]TWC61518.1 hypothetical protein FBY10_1209 [Pseudomonas sp. SJZ103]TWC78714.1 hypothetical protein FBY08_1219 [Pseudomonas sp. SJZ094]
MLEWLTQSQGGPVALKTMRVFIFVRGVHFIVFWPLPYLLTASHEVYMAHLPDFPTVAKVMVTLFIEGTPELIDDFLVICVPSPTIRPEEMTTAELHFDTLLAKLGSLARASREVSSHQQAWQNGETRSQNSRVKALIKDTSAPTSKRRQLEIDFRMDAELQPATVKAAELFLIRLLKHHFPNGSIAASWRADLSDGAIWYGDTQFAYNLLQPGVAGLHPDVHAGLVEHFSAPRWSAI